MRPLPVEATQRPTCSLSLAEWAALGLPSAQRKLEEMMKQPTNMQPEKQKMLAGQTK